MLKLILVLGVAVAVGVTSASLYKCTNKIPLTEILLCIKDKPQMVASNVTQSTCIELDDQCKETECIFRQSQWLSGREVNKPKVAAYYDEAVSVYPDWAAAFNHAKHRCLDKTVKPQGPFLYCPAFDHLQCSFISLIRNAPAAEWSTTDSCKAAREFAMSCDVCSESCDGVIPPKGTCNCL